MLKNISIILAPYLSELFRASLDEGIIPDIWKKSLVIPSFKKGEKSNPLNYRPISLTCCSCRIMEKILVKNIINFLENKKFFSSDQFGFIRRRSTTLQLVSSLEDWYEALFEKKNIDCIYIDFCKAFDSVPHKLLLDKLYACGIRGKLHRWISEFLSNRTYQVKINDVLSNPYGITTGVPQGSIIGPLMFLIYINDLSDVIPNGVKIKLFADDVKIYKVYKTKNERLELAVALKNVEEWSKKWNLDISVDKTFVLHLGKDNPRDQYKIFNNTINEVQSIRDLGIIIDDKLRFKEHINIIIRNAYLRMKTIFRIIKSRKTSTWILIYKSYIRPMLEYAPESWNTLYKTEINSLEKCQKFFTKKVFKKCNLPELPYENRLEYLNLQTLENRRKIFDLMLMYKIVNGYSHLGLETLFSHPIKKSSHSSHRIISKKQNSKSSRSFINRTTKMWNILGKNTILSKSPLDFKNKLKSILIV
nr:unnamed protein product [Meloidogyne enterolobii]